MNADTWLHEMVEWDSAEYIPRRIAIYRFVVYGLYPFLTANGYALLSNEKDFVTSIGTMLYLQRDASCLDSHPLLIQGARRDCIEDKQHFYHVLGWSKWQNFWNEWGIWQDVSLDYERGEDRRIDIQEFCWLHIDLDSSSQSLIVKEHMGLLEENMTGKGEDVYLREAAESNEWGGYRK